MKQIVRYIVLPALLAAVPAAAIALVPGDTLARYIGMAVRNNPLIRSENTLYEASLQDIPQAGAYPDPQLQVGFSLKPMEELGGKRIADFTLMQMFPWFGTKKAAGNEAAQMSVMAFEKFRDAEDQIILQVKTTWYMLADLRQRLATIRENLTLLTILQDLAASRFSAPGNQGATQMSQSPGSPSALSGTQASSGGMPGMGAAAVPQPGYPQAPPQQQSSGMAQMSAASSMNGSSGGMSDVLRVQLGINELRDEEQAVISEITSAVAKFNALLDRAPDAPVDLPTAIALQPFIPDDSTFMQTVRQQNPMLRMSLAEGRAYDAQLRMNRKMALPMLGIGLQYTLMGKRADMGIPVTHMNGKDMVMPMVSVSIPVYRNKYTARQKQSRLMKQAAGEKYRNTLSTLTSTYIALRQQLADAGRKIALYRSQARLAQTAYQLAVKEFAAGKTPMSDVLDIQRQILDYKYRHSEAVTLHNTIVATIESLMSRPARPPAANVPPTE